MSRFVVRLIMSARSFLLRLADAFVPPGMLILEGVFGMAKTRLLQAVVKLEIAQVLERDGPLGAKALAAKVGANPDSLHRALRTLASYGVFTLGPDGRFANNRVSRALIPGRKGAVVNFVRYFSSESNSRAWENLGSTLLTGKNAFEKTYGVSIWEHFSRDAAEGATFGAAMRELTELEAPAIARGYPFSELKSICDVGGGSGALLKEILGVNPGPGHRIDAFVYDQAGATETSASEGIRRVSGSFFDTVPEGPDAYMLKDILHDWDDERALKILLNIRRAMPSGKRLLVIEMLVEPLSTEIPGNLSDLHMMVACSEGRQRSAIEMEKLLHEANFAVERVIALPSTYSIVEAIARA